MFRGAKITNDVMRSIGIIQTKPFDDPTSQDINGSIQTRQPKCVNAGYWYIKIVHGKAARSCLLDSATFYAPSLHITALEKTKILTITCKKDASHD